MQKKPQQTNTQTKNPQNKHKTKQTKKKTHHPVQKQKETRKQQLLDKDKISVDNKTKAKGLGWFV